MAKNRLTDWDTTPANNTDVGGISIAEGWPPENVNNAYREGMSQLAEFHGDITGKLTSGGSSNAYTLTTNDGATTPAAGQLYIWVSNHTNTGAATLEVNGGTAKSILKNHDEALVGGEIEANQIIVTAYEANNDAYLMLSQMAKMVLSTLDVDNLNINGNTISSTNTNGNIIFSPNGTGDVYPGGDGSIDFGATGTRWSGLFAKSAQLKDAVPSLTLLETGSSYECSINVGVLGNLTLNADKNAAALNSKIILKVDNVDQVNVTDGTVEPETDNDIDLGSATKRFKDAYVHGVTIEDSSPVITLTDTTTSASCNISADSAFGSLIIRADIGDASAGSFIRFDVDNVAEVQLDSDNLQPVTNGGNSLGGASNQWQDLYIDGTANIDALTLTSGATCTVIQDQDDMAADSATALATQQSIKAYSDNNTAHPAIPKIIISFTGVATPVVTTLFTSGGSNPTVVRNSTGNYTITYNETFSAAPIVQLTGLEAATTATQAGNICLSANSTTACTVRSLNDAGGNADFDIYYVSVWGNI